MKTAVLMTGLATMMLSGCLMVPYPPDGTLMVAPPLPAIVWLDTGPYYYSEGYTYYYHNSSWNYSNHRGGPWRELPRDRYPREVRHRDRDGGERQGREQNQEHGGRR